MSELNNKYLDEIDITTDELDRITNAFKNNEFKSLFFEYCQELQDPENRKIFEKEIIELESDRGVQVTFLNPIPDFVVKTSVDGKSKAFINIASSDKIDKPVHEIKYNDKIGKKDLCWSLPYAQAPAHRVDYDNRKEKCLVYDVLFHPDALQLAEKNGEIRKHVISIACEAIEREFKVKLDQTNLKFPKMKYKGVPRPTVIRRIADSNKNTDDEPSPLDQYMPPKPTSTDYPTPKIHECTNKKPDDYAEPKYIIKYRRGVDYSEMTNELDAKLNITIPKEIIIEIELPLLKSTSDCTLDVTTDNLYLISEKPAKYQLNIKLPYNVNDKNGSAKFDITTRKLIVQLPIITNNIEKNIKDLYREDSGVESDIKDELLLESPFCNYDHKNKSLIELVDNDHGDENDDNNDDNNDDDNDDGDDDDDVFANDKNDKIDNYKVNENFLLDTIEYNYPSQFHCNMLDDNLCFVINVKNVDPKSINFNNTDRTIHIKFISIGSGYYPIHYSFYCKLDDINIKILNVSTEAWDNNVILTLKLTNYKNFKYYSCGLNELNTKQIEINETFKNYNKILEKDFLHNDNINISYNKDSDDNSIEINITPNKFIENYNTSDTSLTLSEINVKDDFINKSNNNNNNKKNKKKNNKKYRSYSESACDELKSKQLNQQQNNNNNKIINPNNNKNIRSFSESCSNSTSPSFKGILKHYSHYDGSYSYSLSSMDDRQYSYSADMIRQTDSFDNIPEESNNSVNENSSLSESCKKTVRFSSVIHKQLFRLDSSILGQKKKNQKRKNQKQRALLRRNSEGDSFDYEEKQFGKDASDHDSGVDLAELIRAALKSREINDSELSDIDTDNKNYMFHMEI